MSYGLCCISLNLKEQGYGFQTMTYKRFSSLPREKALEVLGERILNNLVVTNETIKYCGMNNYSYRVSSDIFPLITYDEANVNLEDLPNYDDIENQFNILEETVTSGNVRISCHPSEFNSLASISEKVVEKTITELNFYSSFLDRIGCFTDHRCPMNLHVHNNTGSKQDISLRFYENFKKLDINCQKRLTIENDDKLNCWSVKDLIEIFNPITNIPICFDYLHHKCHSNNLNEQEAITMCYNTWNTKPLFHYSESREGNNPRAHADFAYNKFNNYGLDFDIDMELKAKDKAINEYIKLWAQI